MRSDQFLNLHRYLHDPTIDAINYDGTRIEIQQNSLGLRYAIVNGVKYIQQNPKKNTSWARMAQNGQKVTWGIKEGKWDLAIDDEIRVFS